MTRRINLRGDNTHWNEEMLQGVLGQALEDGRLPFAARKSYVTPAIPKLSPSVRALPCV